MSTVYLARDHRLGRRVAIKRLDRLNLHDHALTRRFLRESRLEGQLTHPNVVTVYDFIEDDEDPLIVMELLTGGPLRDVMQGLSLAQAAAILEGVLAGLSAAHDVGIVHRDLKPENVLLTRDGVAKIADFGMAKAIDRVTRTTTQGVLGTPMYMAPEQATGAPVGPWTDLYACGVVAYEMLIGRGRVGAARAAGGVVGAPAHH